MTQSNKKPISFRLAGDDQKKLKLLASRLHTRESELFRYAIHLVLREHEVILDSDLQGLNLLLAMLAAPVPIIQFLRLDSTRLEQIVHSDITTTDTKVEKADLNLVASIATSEHITREKLRVLYKDYNPELPVCTSLSLYLQQKYLENKP